MKVVWICHFSNYEIREKIKKYKEISDLAPWITNLIKGFEKESDVELHIIFPHYFLIKQTNFKLRNVHYYALPAGVPFYHRYYPDYFPIDTFFGYYLFNLRVKRIVNKIRPDIINLIGTENAYYSKSILQFRNKYPVIITIQGYITEILNFHNNFYNRYRSKIEKRIISSFQYFLGDEDSKRFIGSFNKNFKFFNFFFPVDTVSIKMNNKRIDKSYDLLYWGRIDKAKGIEDFIKIVSILKNKNSNIKAAIIGIGNLKYWESYAIDLKCENNIKFIGYVENTENLFSIAQQSKVLLVPTYFDRYPAVIREAMMLKIPVISYKTGSIPYTNQEKKNIILVEVGDYEMMAEEAYKLLNKETSYEEMIENAYEFAMKEFDLESNVKKIKIAYKKTIEEFKY